MSQSSPTLLAILDYICTIKFLQQLTLFVTWISFTPMECMLAVMLINVRDLRRCPHITHLFLFFSFSEKGKYPAFTSTKRISIPYLKTQIKPLIKRFSVWNCIGYNINYNKNVNLVRKVLATKLSDKLRKFVNRSSRILIHRVHIIYIKPKVNLISLPQTLTRARITTISPKIPRRGLAGEAATATSSSTRCRWRWSTTAACSSSYCSSS
jgi:hypothetical protein